MTGIPVGASFNNITWDQINWSACQDVVKRLQARIVQAVQNKRWNKVKALQYLLTRSYSAKALAVKRVTTNKGKWTAGVDRQLWSTSFAKLKAIQDLKTKGYQACPLRRVLIPKQNGQSRPLGIPTMKDRSMQALHLMALEPIAETTADPHSYGFRPHRSTADAIAQIFITLSKQTAPKWILEADIEGCFDAINHDWLIKFIPMNKQILSKWLKAGFIHKRNWQATRAGTPQGGIISPVLANMTLDGMEDVLTQHFGKKGTKKRKASGVHLIRYCDDFILTGKTQEILVEKVRPLIESFLKDRGLNLSSRKTRITSINQGFDFLGQNVRKYKSKLIIKPAIENIQRFLRKIRGIIKKHPSITQHSMIERLNPVIRGWAYYHRKCCARKTFERVDHEIFQSLWRWALRRHNNKGTGWTKRKYFSHSNTLKWCFGTNVKIKDVKQPFELFKATQIPIKRHNKIQAHANPFDKKWYDYIRYHLTKQKYKLRLTDDNVQSV